MCLGLKGPLLLLYQYKRQSFFLVLKKNFLKIINIVYLAFDYSSSQEGILIHPCSPKTRKYLNSSTTSLMLCNLCFDLLGSLTYLKFLSSEMI